MTTTQERLALMSHEPARRQGTWFRLLAAVAVIAALGIGFALGSLHAGQNQIGPEDERRDFTFQVIGYKTPNQGGQVLNMYFHYRYDDGIATSDIPNYVDLRDQALNYLDTVDLSQNPYWETLNQTICDDLHAKFPIQAISCQLQAYPDDRPGLPYEPGYHGSTDTIGDIEPLAVPGPVTP